jgi:hypothetical protein
LEEVHDDLGVSQGDQGDPRIGRRHHLIQIVDLTLVDGCSSPLDDFVWSNASGCQRELAEARRRCCETRELSGLCFIVSLSELCPNRKKANVLQSSSEA